MLVSELPTECSDELRAMIENIDPEDIKLMRIKRSVNHNSTETELREELCFFPYLEDSTYMSLRDLVRSLHEYDGVLESDDFSREDETTKDKCRALLSVTELFVQRKTYDNCVGEFETSSGISLRDPALISLIVNNTDRIGLITGHIRSRLDAGAKIVDPSLLEEALDSTAPAISNGLL